MWRSPDSFVSYMLSYCGIYSWNWCCFTVSLHMTPHCSICSNKYMGNKIAVQRLAPVDYTLEMVGNCLLLFGGGSRGGVAGVAIPPNHCSCILRSTRNTRIACVLRVYCGYCVYCVLWIIRAIRVTYYGRSQLISGCGHQNFPTPPPSRSAPAFAYYRQIIILYIHCII